MPDVAQVLKAEINRLAHKEVLKSFRPLRRQVQDLKKLVKNQRDRLEKLGKALARAQAAAPVPEPKGGEEEVARRARLNAASIKRLRLRLKLAQRELGQLLKVSANTVVQWEAGRSKPRPRYRAELVRLRQLGRRQVKELLAAVAPAKPRAAAKKKRKK